MNLPMTADMTWTGTQSRALTVKAACFAVAAVASFALFGAFAAGSGATRQAPAAPSVSRHLPAAPVSNSGNVEVRPSEPTASCQQLFAGLDESTRELVRVHGYCWEP